jgi:ABC-type transport system involved in cytochrome c biogenesis permease component
MRKLYMILPVLCLFMPPILFGSAAYQFSSQGSAEVGAQLAIAASIALLACVQFVRDKSS